MYDEIISFIFISIVVIAGMPIMMWMISTVALFIGEYIDYKRNNK